MDPGVMIELFSGSGIMAETFRKAGFKVCTFDSELKFNPDVCIDVVHLEEIDANVMWASPPCQRFSVAVIGRNWKAGEPQNKETLAAVELVRHTIKLIAESKPDFWFIENPRGMLRKVIDPLFEACDVTGYVRRTVTYCQYGLAYMKPTDIWTNCKAWKPRPMCKPRGSCHTSAPRGSKKGVQGLNNAFERGKLPLQLCEEIVEAVCMETKSRYEVIAELEATKRSLIIERESFDDKVRDENKDIRELERELEDRKGDLIEFEKSIDGRKETISELIASVDLSLKRFENLKSQSQKK